MEDDNKAEMKAGAAGADDNMVEPELDPGPRPPTPPRRRKTPIELQGLRSPPGPEQPSTELDKHNKQSGESSGDKNGERSQQATESQGPRPVSPISEDEAEGEDEQVARPISMPVSQPHSRIGTPTPRVSTPVSRLATPTGIDNLRPEDRSGTGSPIVRKAIGSAPGREVREVSSVSTIHHFLKAPIMITPDRIGSKGDDIPKTAVIQTNIKRGRGRLQKKSNINWKEIGISWLPEFVWFAIAVLCLITLLAILSSFDGKTLSEMPNVNLNTFVAFFSIAMGLAMLVPVTEALSQWKWNHFMTDQKVSDFQTFEAGSHGLLGASLFLWRFRWTSLASIGPVVMLFGLLAVPLSQLLVAYPTDLAALNRDATVMATRLLESEESAGSLGRADMLNGLSNGFLAAVNRPVLPVFPVCHSSRCTFPPFRSLGVCVKMANITDMIQVEKTGRVRILDAGSNTTSDVYNASVPGCSINSHYDYSLTSCKTNMQTSLSFHGDEDLEKTTIYSMPIIYSNPNELIQKADNTSAPWPFYAVEALFHLCVNEYEVSVLDGIPHTSLRGSSYKIASGAQNGPIDVNCTSPCEALGIEGCKFGECSQRHVEDEGWLALRDPKIEPGEEDEGEYPDHAFGAHIHVLHNLATSMYLVGGGLWGWDGSVAADSDPLSTLTAKVVGGQTFVRLANAIYGDSHDIKDPNIQFERLCQMMLNVATSLTNTIRTLRGSSSDPTHNAYPVYGTVWVHQAHVQIRWGWITWLIIQLAAAMAFVGMTIYFTNKKEVRVLKGSGLASLYALDDEARAATGGIDGMHEMRRKAKFVTVRLNSPMNALVLSGENPDGVSDRDRSGTLGSLDSNTCTERNEPGPEKGVKDEGTAESKETRPPDGI